MAEFVMTESTVRKLDEAFMMGFSDREACMYVGIPYSTFTSWLERHEDYRTKKEDLKSHPKILVKKNIYGALKEGDLDTSKWYADRKMKDDGFTTKQEIDANLGNKDGQPFKTTNMTEAEIDAKIAEFEAKMKKE